MLRVWSLPGWLSNPMVPHRESHSGSYGEAQGFEFDAVLAGYSDQRDEVFGELQVAADVRAPGLEELVYRHVLVEDALGLRYLVFKKYVSDQGPRGPCCGEVEVDLTPPELNHLISASQVHEAQTPAG